MFDIKQYITENVSTQHKKIIAEVEDTTLPQARQKVRTARVAVANAYRSLKLTMASSDNSEMMDIVDAFTDAINILQGVE